MTANTLANPCPPDQDMALRAEALAQVQQTHNELITARAELAELRTKLAREEDRVVMIIEERNLHRHESLRLRKLLMELTTQMANISMLARKAEEFIQEVNEMDERPTPALDVIDKLAADLGAKPPGVMNP